MSNQNQNSQLITMGLSVATFPLLAGLMMMKNISKDFSEWGEQSEEIFRGDRLPLLKFPHE
ncbi:hypothetical protein [Crocosphaera sp. Alani8]|uniref:hypothetical protein n=1 Tax=Crocosphaera sp. Alani8 TaxID=3038952 RepID=UPI00313EDFDA